MPAIIILGLQGVSIPGNKDQPLDGSMARLYSALVRGVWPLAGGPGQVFSWGQRPPNPSPGIRDLSYWTQL